MPQRITTQQLYDGMQRQFDELKDKLDDHGERISGLEREVHGSNGAGLWTQFKEFRKEYREDREEQRQIWGEIAEIKRRVAEHQAEDRGAHEAHKEERDRRQAQEEREFNNKKQVRQRFSVWVLGVLVGIVNVLVVVEHAAELLF